MEKKLAAFKKGLIPVPDRDRLSSKWAEEVDNRSLDKTIVAQEAEALVRQWEKYNVPEVGGVPLDVPPGCF